MARRTAPRPKFSPAEVKKHIRLIQEVVEKNKRANKQEHFTGITPEEIKKKLMRVNSPLIVSQGWGPAVPGGSINYTLGIYNPDPTAASSLYAHVWVGSGNVDPVVGSFLLNVDPRFPRLTEPAAFGLTLQPGDSASLNYTLNVPSKIERSNYLGNSCLIQLNYHDVGTYLDRGVFIFTVS